MRNTTLPLIIAVLCGCLLSACKRGPLAQVPEQKSGFEKQVFIGQKDASTWTLVSPTQCEFDPGSKGAIVLGEYGREGNRLRVVIHAQGAATVRYFDVSDEGLLDPKTGERFVWDAVIRERQAKVRAATQKKPFINSLGMEFVPLPGTSVLFCRWETRVKDYAAFAAATKHEVVKPDFAQTNDHPVVNVSWVDAMEFCKWLSEKEGIEYRLPTDAEWSMAVELPQESGATPKTKEQAFAVVFPWGTEWPPPKGAGNFTGEGDARSNDLKEYVIAGYNDGFKHTSPVGSFTANRFGIHDLAGNVSEWCEDWEDGGQTSRVLRGGTFDDHANFNLMSSRRQGGTPTVRYGLSGFRVSVVGASSSH